MVACPLPLPSDWALVPSTTETFYMPGSGAKVWAEAVEECASQGFDIYNIYTLERRSWIKNSPGTTFLNILLSICLQVVIQSNSKCEQVKNDIHLLQ